jgi:hypothetical protein
MRSLAPATPKIRHRFVTSPSFTPSTAARRHPAAAALRLRAPVSLSASLARASMRIWVGRAIDASMVVVLDQ